MCEPERNPDHTFRNSIYSPKKHVSFAFFYKHELNIHRILISFSMSWAFFFLSTKAYNLACSLQKNTHTSKWKRAMNLLFDLLKTGFRLTALPHTFVWSVYSLIWHSESSETSFIVNVSSKGTFPPHHTTAIQPELSDPFAYYYFSLVGQTSHSAYQN